jgi:hypothetical protein
MHLFKNHNYSLIFAFVQMWRQSDDFAQNRSKFENFPEFRMRFRHDRKSFKLIPSIALLHYIYYLTYVIYRTFHRQDLFLKVQRWGGSYLSLLLPI